MSYPSKTKKSQCFYCSSEMLDENLAKHCKNVHNKPKRVKGQQTLSFAEPVPKKNKLVHREMSDGASNFFEKSPNEETDDIPFNLTSGSTNQTEAHESKYNESCPSGIDNESVGVKLDLIIDEIQKLNLKIPAGLSDSSTVGASKETIPAIENQIDEKLRECKTVTDICKNIEDIVYVPEEGGLTCIRCVISPRQGGAHTPGRFSYDISHDDMYISTKITSREFRNLKTVIRRHFENDFHQHNVKEWEKIQVFEGRRETRVHSIGMRIARLCYSGYQIGSSKRNFEQEVYKSVLNGVDLGDINHSKQFYSDFMPYVSKEITSKMKTYFESRLDQTGLKPPVNVQDDKGTNCHRTRQFTSVVTIVPDSQNLLVVIYLGQPIVKKHDGPGITESISTELNAWGIQGDQVEGGSFDGQYFHLGVPDLLQKQMQLPEQFLCTWDPMHKGGVVDTHIREDINFSWLVEVQVVCKEIYTTFNWGKNYENFLQVCKDLDIEMKKLTNFQMTRFANSVRHVFMNLRTDYAAVRQSLSDVVSSKEQSSNSKDRAKAEECRTVLRKIDSWVFALTLSGCADIYNLFGVLSNICQEVNILPFERYDSVKRVIERFRKLFTTMDHSNCPAKCQWERYHADLILMESKKTYMGVSIGNINIGTTRQTRLAAQNDLVHVADGTALVQERLYTLAWRLHHDLSNEIFDKDTAAMIEHCRVVSDLASLLKKIDRKGPVLVGLEESNKFINSARAITGTIKSISDCDLAMIFREFVTLLEVYFIRPQGNSFDPSKLDNKKLIQNLLEREMSSQFATCKLILHCLSAACVKVSVESVVESIVSKYENHFDSSRQPSEDHALSEMVIAENGPLLHQAEGILENSMNCYWKENSTNGKWHFLRTSDDIRGYTGGASKVIGKLMDRKSKLPFM